MKGYGYLTISIVGEVFGTMMLKLSNGFSVLGPSLGVVFGYGVAFYCLSLCLRTLPLSLAYAIWSGAGTALTALLGYLIWDEVFGLLKLLGIAFIIGGIIVLNSSDSSDKRAKSVG